MQCNFKYQFIRAHVDLFAYSFSQKKINANTLFNPDNCILFQFLALTTTTITTIKKISATGYTFLGNLLDIYASFRLIIFCKCRKNRPKNKNKMNETNKVRKMFNYSPEVNVCIHVFHKIPVHDFYFFILSVCWKLNNLLILC